MTAKGAVQEILEKLPEDVSFEDIQYHIYVREKIERGLAAVRAGDIASDEEVEAIFKKWTGE